MRFYFLSIYHQFYYLNRKEFSKSLRKEIQHLYLLIREKGGLLEGLPRERESGILIPLREAEGGMWSRNESA